MLLVLIAAIRAVSAAAIEPVLVVGAETLDLGAPAGLCTLERASGNATSAPIPIDTRAGSVVPGTIVGLPGGTAAFIAINANLQSCVALVSTDSGALMGSYCPELFLDTLSYDARARMLVFSALDKQKSSRGVYTLDFTDPSQMSPKLVLDSLPGVVEVTKSAFDAASSTLYLVLTEAMTGNRVLAVDVAAAKILSDADVHALDLQVLVLAEREAKLYAWAASAESPGALVEVDPATGVARSLGNYSSVSCNGGSAAILAGEGGGGSGEVLLYSAMLKAPFGDMREAWVVFDVGAERLVSSTMRPQALGDPCNFVLGFL